MKVLVICSTLDLNYKLGCTPSWWQLLKALHETGNEVIAVPFLGDPIESLWWRCYPNPCAAESKLYNRFLDWKKTCGTPAASQKSIPPILNRYSENHIRLKWENFLISILNKERDIEALFFMNVPLNYIKGIPEKIKSFYGIPVAYYDGDMPTILPKYASERGFKFNYYLDTDLSVFNAFFTNSKGVIPDLKALGAKNVHPLYYAADPELFKPVKIDKDIDISFYGHGSEFREEWMKKMITESSNILLNRIFSVGGIGFDIDLGKAKMAGYMKFCAFRKFCCQSKLCLNITRWSHTSVYASATARPFELAAFGACIVSQPYSGIEEWFEAGREIVVINDKTDIPELYEDLLSCDEERERMGKRARERILKEHTYLHRAVTIIDTFKKISNRSNN